MEKNIYARHFFKHGYRRFRRKFGKKAARDWKGGALNIRVLFPLEGAKSHRHMFSVDLATIPKGVTLEQYLRLKD